jgi:hypothetical protein
MASSKFKHRDKDLRSEVYKQLIAIECRHKNTLVIDELGLSHGSVRIDIAILNGHIHGLELKSDSDNLKRLARQVEGYGQVVDRATLIVAERHLENALTLGVIAAKHADDNGIQFHRVRRDGTNRKVDAATLAKLLWHGEVAAELEKLGLSKKLCRAPRSTLYQELVSRLPKRTIATLVRETLKARKTWRDQKRPSLYGGLSRPISKS